MATKCPVNPEALLGALQLGVLFTAMKCSSMICQWRFIPKGMGYYRGVWHGVPMALSWFVAGAGR